MIKISIIVPIYNAGKYLNGCLDALHSQTMQDIEFILILDCPTDGSDKIAEIYAQKDRRFVIIKNQHNMHIGNSRNRGLAIAKGEYIAFADHDDYMSPKMYDILYRQAKQSDADIVLSFATINKDGVNIVWKPENLHIKNIQEYVLKDLISSGGIKHNASFFSYIHNNLYRKSLITTHNLQFIDTITTTPEDVIFNIESIYFAKNVKLYNQSLYIHRMLPQSAGHQMTYTDWEKRFNGVKYLYDWLTKRDIYKEYEKEFLLYAQKREIDGLISLILRQDTLSSLCRAFKELRKYSFTKDIYTNYCDNQIRPLHKRIIRRILAFLLYI